ncbi:MAG: LuxR C-terminal-related transcriptional regulator [Gammaproteobacteria bacterium]
MLTRTLLPLLQAKFRPPSSNVPPVPRARVLDTVRCAPPGKLTLITAPPGYGKTAVMRQLFEQRRGDNAVTAWLGLDAADNDFAQLARCVADAVRAVHPAFGEPVAPLLRGGANVSDAAITHTLANALSALDREIYLFVEDVHELTDDRALEVLRQLIVGTAAHVRLIVSSRTHFDVGLGRLRATGGLVELTWDDLRFDEGEIRRFFRQANSLDLATEVVGAIAAKTEGWAAALQLASIAGRDAPALTSLLDRLDGSSQAIAAYLAEEVLHHLEPNLRHFLLRIGTLRRVCAPLCEAVTGRRDAALMLDRIVALNLFVFATDDRARWLRFHPLLCDFLAREMERTCPDDLAAVRRAASDWFETRGAYDEAVDYAFDGGDVRRAARILDQHAYDLWTAGHQSRLDGWARRIPPRVRRAHFNLRLIQAWSLVLAGKAESAVRIVDGVSRDLAALPSAKARSRRPDHAAVFGDVLFVRLMMAYYAEDIEATEALCERWLNGAYSDDPFRLGAVETVLAGIRGLEYDFSYARRYAAVIGDALEETSAFYGPLWLYTILGAGYLGAGLTLDAFAALQKALAFATRVGGAGTPLAAMPATILARAYYDRNEVAQAQRLIGRYAAVPERLNFPDYQICAFFVPVRLLACNGAYAAALALLDEHERAAADADSRPERVTAHLVHERVRLLVRLRRHAELVELGRAGALDRDCGSFHPRSPGTAARAVWAQARARADLARGEHKLTLDLTRRWVRFARARGVPRLELEFRLLAALAYAAGGDRRGEQRELRAAIGIAGEQQLLQPLLDERDQLRTAMALACDTVAQTAPELGAFVGAVRAALGDADGTERAAAAGPVQSGELTPRERDVVCLVAKGLSNREIGEVLGLAEGTVKWNLHQVFGKLDVRRRSQAVWRARELGLLV